jgi:hypothetical protein
MFQDLLTAAADIFAAIARWFSGYIPSTPQLLLFNAVIKLCFV